MLRGRAPAHGCERQTEPMRRQLCKLQTSISCFIIANTPVKTRPKYIIRNFNTDFNCAQQTKKGVNWTACQAGGTGASPSRPHRPLCRARLAPQAWSIHWLLPGLPRSLPWGPHLQTCHPAYKAYWAPTPAVLWPLDSLNGWAYRDEWGKKVAVGHASRTHAQWHQPRRQEPPSWGWAPSSLQLRGVLDDFQRLQNGV